MSPAFEVDRAESTSSETDATWSWTSPEQTVLAGPTSLARLGDLLAQRRIRRILVVSNDRSPGSDFDDLVGVALDGVVRVRARTQIGPHAPLVAIEALADEVRAGRPDAVLAHGGGSVCDAVKGALVLASGRPLELRPRSVETPPRAPILPLITIPTTLAGAEFTPVGAMISGGVKRFFGWPGLSASVTVYDPRAIAYVRPEVLISTGMNGLAHMVEAAYGPRRSPISDSIAREGARILAGALVGLAGDAPRGDVLGKLQTGAIMGGLALAQAGTAIHHSIGHVLGGHFGLAHGTASAVVLPYAVAFNSGFVATEQRDLHRSIAPVLDAAGLAPQASLAGALRALQAALGLPDSLAAVGLTEQDLPTLRDEILLREPGLNLNPRVIDARSLDLLLAAAHRGDLQLLTGDLHREG